MNEVADIAFAIARTNAPAMEKLDQLMTAVQRHNKMTLVKQKHMHDLIAAATQENWAIIKAHIERMVTIFETIIREVSQPESSTSKMPRMPRERSSPRSCRSSIRF